MARRTQAREVALQMLYQLDVNPDVEVETIRAQIREQLHEDEAVERFCWQLVAGVREARSMLDTRIQEVAANWSLARMAVTDRNALRIGAFELLCTDTPHRVVIDEAIELARRFGAANSPQFVNGILDRLVPADRRPARPADETT
jgi:N utilization substance protein B